MNAISELIIYKLWYAYNNLFDHLEKQNEVIKKFKLFFSTELQNVIDALKKKLTQYYKKIKVNQELFCNLDVILNSCNKLNMYNVEYSQSSINII